MENQETEMTPHGWMGLLVHTGGCAGEMPSVPADIGRAPKPAGQMVPWRTDPMTSWWRCKFTSSIPEQPVLKLRLSVFSARTGLGTGGHLCGSAARTALLLLCQCCVKSCQATPSFGHLEPSGVWVRLSWFSHPQLINVFFSNFLPTQRHSIHSFNVDIYI